MSRKSTAITALTRRMTTSIRRSATSFGAATQVRCVDVAGRAYPYGGARPRAPGRRPAVELYFQILHPRTTTQMAMLVGKAMITRAQQKTASPIQKPTIVCENSAPRATTVMTEDESLAAELHSCRDCTDCRNPSGRRPPRWSKPKATLVAVRANPYRNPSRHLTRKASNEYMEKSPTRTKGFGDEQPHRTPASADATLCLRRPRRTAWVSTHFQQGSRRVKPDGNVESLAPDYCNRIWGVIAETMRTRNSVSTRDRMSLLPTVLMGCGYPSRSQPDLRRYCTWRRPLPGDETPWRQYTRGVRRQTLWRRTN